MARFTKTSLTLEDAIADAYLYVVENTAKNLYDVEAVMGGEPVSVIGTIEEKDKDGISSIRRAFFIEYPKNWEKIPAEKRAEVLRERYDNLLNWAALSKEQNTIQLWMFGPMPEWLPPLVRQLEEALSFQFEIVQGEVLKQKLLQTMDGIGKNDRTYDNYFIRTIKFMQEHGISTTH